MQTTNGLFGRLWLRLSKSMLIGVVATLMSMAMLVALVKVMHLSPQRANLPSLALGSVIQFFGNRKFVFSLKNGPIFRQGFFFALTEVGTFTLNTLGFNFVMSSFSVHYVIVRLAVTSVVYLGFSFPVWHLVFRHQLYEISAPLSQE